MLKHSRECLALRVGRSLEGIDVVEELQRLNTLGRKPLMIRIDNGSEFTSKELDTGCYLNDVKLDFIRRGKLVENCFVESFNGQLCDECLNANLFFTLAQVEKIVTVWKEDYNNFRPHGLLGGIPPSEMGAKTAEGFTAVFPISAVQVWRKDQGRVKLNRIWV